MFGFAPGCLGYSAYTHAAVMAAKPTTLSFEEAATTPTVFLTVLAAFGEEMRTRHDARVLVHAGTGGVGLTAMNLARALGWQVATTAGSPSKRSHLRRQGIMSVADSRNTSFLDPLTLAAGSFDIVLNSLTSPGERHCTPWASESRRGACKPLDMSCGSVLSICSPCRHGCCHAVQSRNARKVR